MASSELNRIKEKLSKLGSFSYSDKNSLKSDYQRASRDYNNWINNYEKNGYNKYISDVDSLFGEIMNQEKFSYDPEKDQLFQMYKQQYQKQGTRAMQNQLGVGAALSGGYNSSAAQTASQNAYQGYMNALGETASKTYQNALDMYKYNQQNLLDKYNTARDMNNAGNEEYWKKADIKAQNLANAYNTYSSDRDFQFNKFSSDRSFYQNQSKNEQDRLNWLNEYNLQKKLYKGK